MEIAIHETRDAWQSQAYSPLGAVVSPPPPLVNTYEKHLLTDHVSA